MINELIGINDPIDFVETTSDDWNEFIMFDVEKHTSTVRDNHKHRLVIVLHSAFNNYPQTSLVQHRY